MAKLPVPEIVASLAFPGQTNSVNTTLFTTVDTAVYRVTLGGNAPSGFGPGFVISWVDATGNASITLQCYDGGGISPSQTSLIHALAGTSISISSNFTGPVAPYNLYIIVEELV